MVEVCQQEQGCSRQATCASTELHLGRIIQYKQWRGKEGGMVNKDGFCAHCRASSGLLASLWQAFLGSLSLAAALESY